MRIVFVLMLLFVIEEMPAHADEPYRILRTVTEGGNGGFDYIHADGADRRLYIARSGKTEPRIAVFDLDTLAPAGEIAGVSAHGVAVDAASHHGFASSSPVAMFDTQTQKVIRTMPIGGEADGLLAADGRVYIHGGGSPNLTAYDPSDGRIIGTLDLKADPEQTVSDGNGHLYVDLNDKNQVAVVDAKSLTVTARHDLGPGCGLPTGLAVDSVHRILFVGCRNPASLTVLDADHGTILATVPIGLQNDGVAFNPATDEAFVPAGDGHLTIVKESTPTRFAVEQILDTPPGARAVALDAKTGHVFLMTADYAPAAPGTVVKPGRIARGPMVPGTFKITEVGR
jgi:DNA-binding beta-propeller fold protein YncE